ncbi:MAG: hypothetical protein JWQ23_2332 [Herminiimonas sp.]|nr:hypothetical protein [Herminiimonas sp.]
MSSAWESFHRSMYMLVGADSQRERLVKAYKLNLARLTKKDVPAEIRIDFINLTKDITRNPRKENGCPVMHTVYAIEEREVVAMINSIVRMYDVVTRYQPISTSRNPDDHLSSFE